MRVVGVDPALENTGLARVVAQPGTAPEWYTHTIVTKTRTGTPATWERLLSIVDAVVEWTYGADLVVIERPVLAHTTRGGASMDRSGLYWLIMDRLYQRRLAVAVVASASRQKYATGKGNARKDAVLAAAIRRIPDAPIRNNDEGDAVVLAAMGADWLGLPAVSMPISHREALDKVEWPPGYEDRTRYDAPLPITT